MGKVSLDTQTRYLWLIFGRKNSPLTEDFKVYYEKLKAWCDINAETYGFIGHDQDLDEEDNPKFRHIHSVIILKKGLKPRLSTSLNTLSKVLSIAATDIDVEEIDNITSCFRYLIHKGYPTKHQYDRDQIVTNLDDKERDSLLDLDEKTFTASYLISLVQLCNCSIIKILKEIGLKNYARYRNVIIDIIRELKDISSMGLS